MVIAGLRGGRRRLMEGRRGSRMSDTRSTRQRKGSPGQEMMRGPMLQALLEDRFKLKIHQETREVPVYALTVAKNGPKLKAFEEGSCVAFETFKLPAAPTPETKFPTFCGMTSRAKSASGVNWRLHGGTLDDLARALGMDLDRIVINKTGIEGKYEFEMDFAVDETTAGLNSLGGRGGVPAYPIPAEPTGGLSVFTAIQQQLGLKLESAKGPREFFVIDRVEKPPGTSHSVCIFSISFFFASLAPLREPSCFSLCTLKPEGAFTGVLSTVFCWPANVVLQWC